MTEVFANDPYDKIETPEKDEITPEVIVHLIKANTPRNKNFLKYLCNLAGFTTIPEDVNPRIIFSNLVKGIADTSGGIVYLGGIFKKGMLQVIEGRLFLVDALSSDFYDLVE